MFHIGRHVETWQVAELRLIVHAGPPGLPGFHPDDFTPEHTGAEGWNDIGVPPGQLGPRPPGARPGAFPRRFDGAPGGFPGRGGGGGFGGGFL